MKKVVLCSTCAACPEVIINDDHVIIGEFDNIVKLKPEEWDILKQKIKSGEL